MLEMRVYGTVMVKSPYQSALDLYETSKKRNVDVIFGDLRLKATAALVAADELEQIVNREKYAGTIGGMFFITRETPKEYWPFAVFHELAEHSAPRGFDVTGLSKHYQAIVVELAYAKCVLAPEQYIKYLEWRKSVERTRFFKVPYDESVDKVVKRMREIFELLPRFLIHRRRQLVEIMKEEK